MVHALRSFCNLRKSPVQWGESGESLQKGSLKPIDKVTEMQLLSPWEQTIFNRKCRQAQLSFP